MLFVQSNRLTVSRKSLEVTYSDLPCYISQVERLRQYVGSPGHMTNLGYHLLGLASLPTPETALRKDLLAIHTMV